MNIPDTTREIAGGWRWNGVKNSSRISPFFLGLASVLAASISHGEMISNSISIAAPVTNTLQLRQLALHDEVSGCSVRLDGTVLWVAAARDKLLFQDGAGAILLKADLQKNPEVRAERHIAIEGGCEVGRGEIGSIALVDDDGNHSVSEGTGETYLSAGLHPMRVEWFNSGGEFSLEVDRQGPGMARRPVPDEELFCTNASASNGTNDRARGLNYQCYEGRWEALPVFSQLPVVKRGVVKNFDIGPRTRDEGVAMVFTGYFSAPQAGLYRFWLKSDDGSRLFIGDLPLHLTVLGDAPAPEAKKIISSQESPAEQEGQWTEIEGTISSIHEQSKASRFELNSAAGPVYVHVLEENGLPWKLLLHSRIRCVGLFQNARAVDNKIVPSLVVPGLDQISILEMDPAHWTEHPVETVGLALASAGDDENDGGFLRLSGTVRSSQPGQFVVEDATGHTSIECPQTPPVAGEQIEVLGWWKRSGGATVLNGYVRKLAPDAGNPTEGLPLLTTAAQVMGLSRQEAQRGYPVKIRGVITARVGVDFFIQDATWSIYVSYIGPAATGSPHIGDYWEIEGNSRADFAPDVQIHHAAYLGPGILPEPILPTWDELINGAVATKYVEILGVVTAAQADEVVLLIRGGKVNIQCHDLKEDAFKSLEGALVRVRGVSSPDRDKNQMLLPRLRLFNTSFTVDEPPPAQPFALPLKHAYNLLLFDARADALRRVRIAGQVLCDRHGEFYLMDGTNGFRFKPKESLKLTAGEQVEVVGFPDMNGTSPVLREALVRQLGRTNLPEPRELAEDGMLNGRFDSTRVRLSSRLIGASVDRADQLLELQAGNRNYVARLEKRNGELPNILLGSLLELTGVYVGQGGDRSANRDIDSFEILLNSPADIRVLARPSWWTIRHALTVMGALFLGLLVAVVWITMLRRQVEERSQQLTAEIKSRERAERQHALEEERTRIAQDLHDDLGATLTEIRFLSAVKSHDSLVPENTRHQLSEVSEKSRQLVSSLDEIVWAVNPANDSLPSLASYLRHAVEEFFRNTSVRCRLDVDEALPPVALTSEVRHNLYLSVREALNNVAKHAHASEVWLRIHWSERMLSIVLEDNGCGFANVSVSAAGNGLPNMRRRLEKIGGCFECESRLGSGTICRMLLPIS